MSDEKKTTALDIAEMQSIRAERLQVLRQKLKRLTPGSPEHDAMLEKIKRWEEEFRRGSRSFADAVDRERERDS